LKNEYKIGLAVGEMLKQAMARFGNTLGGDASSGITADKSEGRP